MKSKVNNVMTSHKIKGSYFAQISLLETGAFFQPHLYLSFFITWISLYNGAFCSVDG